MADNLEAVGGESGQVGPLDGVRMAASTVTAARYSLRQAVRAAHQAGEDVTAIAKAAGISRPKAYEMLRPAMEDAKAPPESRWPRVLDEAMVDLLDQVGPATVEQLLAGIESGDLAAKARRLVLGLKNRQRMPEPGTLEWERSALATLVLDALRERDVL